MTLEGFNYEVEIKIEDSTLRSVFKVEEEAYTIKIEEKKAAMKSATYVGFVRAL